MLPPLRHEPRPIGDLAQEQVVVGGQGGRGSLRHPQRGLHVQAPPSNGCQRRADRKAPEAQLVGRADVGLDPSAGVTQNTGSTVRSHRRSAPSPRAGKVNQRGPIPAPRCGNGHQNPRKGQPVPDSVTSRPAGGRLYNPLWQHHPRPWSGPATGNTGYVHSDLANSSTIKRDVVVSSPPTSSPIAASAPLAKS